MRRGFAIITGLFAVMLLFLLSTIVLSTVSHDFGFTRSGLETLQARYLARAAISSALNDLNRAMAWEDRLKAEHRKETFPEGSFEVWIEPVPGDTFKIHLIAVGTAGGRSERIDTMVAKSPAIAGLEYAVNRDSGVCTLHCKGESDSRWSSLPDPPQKYTTDGLDSLDVPPGHHLEYRSPVGDRNGRLYTAARIAPDGDATALAAVPDMVLRYDPTTSEWKRMPALPSPGGVPVHIESLALNYGTDLYALQKGGDWSIFHMKTSAPAWDLIPPAPAGFKAPVDPRDPAPLPFNSGLSQPRQICVDNSGHIYSLNLSDDANPDDRVHRILRCDLASGTWTMLPQPTQVTFRQRVTGRGYTIQTKKLAVTRLRYLAVDRATEQVFAQDFQDDEVSTIYHFTGDDTALGGTWTADPLPPPGLYWDVDNRRWVRDEQWASMRFNTLDQASNLLGVWTLPAKPDTIFQCDLAQKGWHPLPPISSSPTANVAALGGGGTRLDSRNFMYVPVTTY